MALLLKPDRPSTGTAWWRDPAGWLREQRLGGGFWIFFTAAFFFDAGFSVYFFLFNLFLLDLHFNDRWIGFIGGAMTLGSLVGTLPAGAVARRFGVRPLLIFCFLAAPACGILRALWVWPPAQLALAFLAGIAMCGWAVGYLPGIAALTREENRAAGYSLVYSVSVACAALGAVVCGNLPHWLSRMGWAMPDVAVKRLILIASCALAVGGLGAILRLPALDRSRSDAPAEIPAMRRLAGLFRLDPFLVRFLPAIALWTVVLASFTPFANVYLSRNLHIPLASIGLIFAATQALQVGGAMLNPLLYKSAGLVNGIAASQIVTALTLFLLAISSHGSGSIALFLGFSAVQWMSTPGLYNLLMNETPEANRSTAAALTMFTTSLVSSIATACAGSLFARFGYPPVLLGLAAFTLAVAILCSVVLRTKHSAAAAQPATDSDSAEAPARRAG